MPLFFGSDNTAARKLEWPANLSKVRKEVTERDSCDAKRLLPKPGRLIRPSETDPQILSRRCDKAQRPCLCSVRWFLGARVCRFVCVLPTLTAYRLSGQTIGDAGATAIAQELSTNKTLQKLELWSAFVDSSWMMCPPR